MGLRWTLIVVLSVSLTSFLTAQNSSETTLCDAKPDWITQVRRPADGWDTKFVGVPRKFSRPTPVLTSQPGFEDVLMSEYTSRRKYLAWTEVIVYPCNHSVSLRTERLLIENVYGFSVKGRAFAYDVKANSATLEDALSPAPERYTYLLI